MLKRVSTIIAPPVFPEDEDKTRKAKYANAIAIALLTILIAFESFLRAFANYTAWSYVDLIMVGLAGVCFTALVLLRRGHIRTASVLLVVLIWFAANGLAATGFGARDASYITNLAIALMAGLLLGWQASLVVMILSVFSGFALANAEQNGLITVPSYPVLSFVRDIAFIFGLNSVLIYLLINGLESALKKSRLNLADLESANASLHQAQSELQDRTADLIVANEQLENRSKKLHATTLVAHTTASIREFERLLASITNTISEQLRYYHVGIFLLDEEKQYAILRYANTEIGQQMIDRGYRLPISHMDPMGLVVQSGQPQITLSANTVSSNNADLPETRSQILLPLESGDQVIGVLDLQAREVNAFGEDDLSTLSILADQVAITIQNSLLYEQSQNALREAGITSLQSSSQAWKEYEKRVQTRGYRYDGVKSEPLKTVKAPNTEKDSLLLPVQLRGQTIGRLKINASDPSREWTEDELAMVKATAERVALALEGARLLDEAQKRATREAFLSEVATKLSSSFQLDSILRDTVQELGQTMKDSTVTFQLISPSAPDPSKVEETDGASAHNQKLGAGDD